MFQNGISSKYMGRTRNSDLFKKASTLLLAHIYLQKKSEPDHKADVIIKKIILYALLFFRCQIGSLKSVIPFIDTHFKCHYLLDIFLKNDDNYIK